MTGVEVIVETTGGQRVVVTPLLDDARTAALQSPISAASRRQELGERTPDPSLRRLSRRLLNQPRAALGY